MPPLRVLKNVFVTASLLSVAKFSKRLPLLFSSSRPYAPSTPSSSVLSPSIFRPVRAFASISTKRASFFGIRCTKLLSLCQNARFFSLSLGSVGAYPTTKLTAWCCPDISKCSDIRRSLTSSLVNLDVLHIDSLTANATPCCPPCVEPL